MSVKTQGRNRLNGSTPMPVEPTRTAIRITKPDMRVLVVKVIGTSPYVQHKFSEKAKQQMIDKQKEGSRATKGKQRQPKDFDAHYEAVQYKPKGETWPNGAIPATAFRAAMIAACRLVDFKMTEAKQCVFVEQDGFDADERIPLVKITKGKPSPFTQALPNSNGNHDIRIRPMWEPGWEVVLRLQYDAGKFSQEDVMNLLARAGCQVGIGEGRMASRSCAGLGWGAFAPEGY